MARGISSPTNEGGDNSSESAAEQEASDGSSESAAEQEGSDGSSESAAEQEDSGNSSETQGEYRSNRKRPSKQQHKAATEETKSNGYDETSPIVAAESAVQYARQRRARIGRGWQITAEPEDFRVVSYDEASETLTVMLQDPVAVNQGSGTVSFEGHQPLLFGVNARQAEHLETRWRAGALNLRLRFALSANETLGQPYCGTNSHGGPELHGLLLEASLVDPMRSSVFAVTRTERAVNERCALHAESNDHRFHPERYSDQAMVHVQGLESMGSEPMTQAEAVLLTLFAELVLGECYFEATLSNAALEGAVVVNFHLKDNGAISDPSFAIDALRSHTFRTCAFDAFSSTRLPRLEGSQPLETRMTIIFDDSEH